MIKTQVHTNSRGYIGTQELWWVYSSPRNIVRVPQDWGTRPSPDPNPQELLNCANFNFHCNAEILKNVINSEFLSPVWGCVYPFCWADLFLSMCMLLYSLLSIRILQYLYSPFSSPSPTTMSVLRIHTSCGEAKKEARDNREGFWTRCLLLGGAFLLSSPGNKTEAWWEPAWAQHLLCVPV